MVSLRIPLLCVFVAFSAVIADHVLFPQPLPTVHMADKVCEHVYNATYGQCATEMENLPFDAKNLPICERIAQSAANTCNQVGQGIALPGPAPKGDSQ